MYILIPSRCIQVRLKRKKHDKRQDAKQGKVESFFSMTKQIVNMAETFCSIINGGCTVCWFIYKKRITRWADFLMERGMSSLPSVSFNLNAYLSQSSLLAPPVFILCLIPVISDLSRESQVDTTSLKIDFVRIGQGFSPCFVGGGVPTFF